MSQLATTIRKEILGDEPISQGAISKILNEFKYQLAYEPDYLLMHPEAYREISQKLDQVFLIPNNTIMGLESKVDSSLSIGEWRVGKEDYKVEELRT